MTTMMIYYDRFRKDAHKVTPTEMFYRDDKGKRKKPTHGQWQALANALVPNYYSFELLGETEGTLS